MRDLKKKDRVVGARDGTRAGVCINRRPGRPVGRGLASQKNMEDATRATVHDDRFERQGAACLWTSAAEARPPLGAPLRGEVLWQTPDGYVALERPPEREGGPRARLADVGRKSTQVLVTKVGPAAYAVSVDGETCLLYTSPSPRDGLLSRMPSSA